MTCWEIFNKGEPSETIIGTYYKVLENYSIEEIEKAFSNSIGNLKWFPKPIELLEFVVDSPPLSIEDRATTQAMIVLEYIQTFGSYSIPNWKDSTTDIVIKRGFGGWRALCGQQLSKDNQWFIKDFIRLYRSFDNHVKYLEVTEPLKQIKENL